MAIVNKLMAGRTDAVAASQWEAIDAELMAMVGSVSVPLSETSGSNAQERSERKTPSHFVPSLPSADGSIAQARKAVVADWSAAAQYAHSAWSERRLPQFIGLLDRLIRLCQSEAKQELLAQIETLSRRVSELTAERDEEIKATQHTYRAGYEQGKSEFESLAAERQQEIERLRQVIAAAASDRVKGVWQCRAERLVEMVQALASEGYKYWDSDRDMSAGKVLSALAGVRGMRPQLDKLYAEITYDESKVSAEAAESSLALLHEQRTTDVQELIAQLDAAHDELSAAVRRQWDGAPAFKLSIPARPERDTDLLIGAALRAARAALTPASSAPSSNQETA